MVCEFESCIGLCADSSEPGACFCVSLSPCPSLAHALSLSHTQINKHLKNSELPFDIFLLMYRFPPSLSFLSNLSVDESEPFGSRFPSVGILLIDTLDAIQERSSAFPANWQLNPEVRSASGSVTLARPQVVMCSFIRRHAMSVRLFLWS